MVSVLQRYYAGDGLLMDEIEANARSAGPIQQMARSSLVTEALPSEFDTVDLPFKKRRMELAMAREEAEVQALQIANVERKLALEERKLEHETKLIQHVNTAMGSINALKDWANVDARTKLQAEDHIKNVLFNKLASPADPATITDGTKSTEALNVSILAKELGFKCSEGQLQRIGREMAKKYRETYQSDPPKHKQFVGGMCIPINSYMERDRSMMELVIQTVMS
jgi:hypothetical protein